MAPDLDVATRVRPGGVVVVELVGALDAHTAEAAEQLVWDLFDEGFCRMVFDLRRLRCITSAGAGVLIGAISVAQEHRGDVALVNPLPGVRQILNLLGLDRLFRIYDDIEEAEAGMRVLVELVPWKPVRPRRAI